MKFGNCCTIATFLMLSFSTLLNTAQAASFCPEGGEHFTGSEKFCPTHGVALKPVSGAAASKGGTGVSSGKKTAATAVASQKQADEWYQQALNYYSGEGVEADPNKAMSFHRKAASAGNTVAQVSLGFIYETGDEGFAVDFAEALKWYRMAVAQGDPVGRYALANMYLGGKGVAQDYAKAAQMYSESAAQESKARHLAQQQLGDLYLEGKGVPQDLKKAESLWLAAVGTGYAYSQNMLGKRYESGAFGQVDLDNARKYYTLAAAQGNDEARTALENLDAKAAEADVSRQVMLEGVEKAAGGYRVEELFAKCKSLAGQAVKVRGRVTKSTQAILDSNWLRLQDGSGRERTNTLIVRTKFNANVGDLVVAEGTLACDKDFGYGYIYEAIMEDATVMIER